MFSGDRSPPIFEDPNIGEARKAPRRGAAPPDPLVERPRDQRLPTRPAI